jgi:putative restriction endonuclease
MVKLYLANTDNEWFELLSRNPKVDEVNFWQPSAKNFNAISIGEIIAFRLKSPRAKIGGFGILSSSSILPIQITWDAFGEKNGRSSVE